MAALLWGLRLNPRFRRDHRLQVVSHSSHGESKIVANLTQAVKVQIGSGVPYLTGARMVQISFTFAQQFEVLATQ
jgi:hypothetical protein